MQQAVDADHPDAGAEQQLGRPAPDQATGTSDEHRGGQRLSEEILGGERFSYAFLPCKLDLVSDLERSPESVKGDHVAGNRSTPSGICPSVPASCGLAGGICHTRPAGSPVVRLLGVRSCAV